MTLFMAENLSYELWDPWIWAGVFGALFFC